MANFKLGKGDYGGIAGWSDDGADITIQVKAYPPNDFGVYDMAGNVAEWVSDVYRPIIDDEANDFNYYRGNVYMKEVIGEDGKAQVISPDQLVYDTLPNGKVLLKRIQGNCNCNLLMRKKPFYAKTFHKVKTETSVMEIFHLHESIPSRDQNHLKSWQRRTLVQLQCMTHHRRQKSRWTKKK